MMLPSNSDWNFMRREVQRFYPDTIEICTLTGVKDKFGQESVTVTVDVTVKGQLSAPSGSHRLLLDSLRNQGVLNEETYVLHLPYGTAVDIENIIRTVSGNTYDIVHLNTEQTFTAALEIIITRRNVYDHLRINNDY